MDVKTVDIQPFTDQKPGTYARPPLCTFSFLPRHISNSGN